jgi:hypothetical protein
MSNEHTPGPWKALTRDPLFSKRNRFDILLAADEDMSSQSWASVIGPNSEADARLIAAAPELDAYREYIEDNLERIARGGWTPVCFDEFRESEWCANHMKEKRHE